METSYAKSVSEAQFQEALIPQTLRRLRLMQGSLGAGILLLAFGMGYIFVERHGASSPVPEAIAQVRLLSIISALWFAVSIVISNILVARSVRIGLSVNPGTSSAGRLAATNDCVLAIQRGVILGLSLRTSPAILGIAVCFIATTSGVLPAYPLVWLNALPAIYACALFAITMPTRERLYEMFRRHTSTAF